MLEESDTTVAMMGGSVMVVVAHERGQRSIAQRDLRRSVERMHGWAKRLTRFSAESELSELNREADAGRSNVSPLLASVLTCAARVSGCCGGAVDVGMLDARLAAEAGVDAGSVPGRSRWWLRHDAGVTWVHRRGRVAFDLDGVAKGWMADRILATLAHYPAALVDADGDIACRDDIGLGWTITIDDPADDACVIAAISLESAVGRGPIGVATSGTTRHRWWAGETMRHHLIDSRTGRSAHGQVVQATVVASCASMAEGLAKVAIIDGVLAPPLACWGRAAIVYMADGGTSITAGTRPWLAA